MGNCRKKATGTDNGSEVHDSTGACRAGIGFGRTCRVDSRRVDRRPALCIFQFISPIREGQEVEIAFPLARLVEVEGVYTRVQSELKVLSLEHKEPDEELTVTYSTLFGRAAEHGLITGEFCREVYADWSDPMAAPIEVQLVLHDWIHLLMEHSVRVLGDEQAARVPQGHERITTNIDLQQRYACVKEIIERIDKLDDFKKFDIFSS